MHFRQYDVWRLASLSKMHLALVAECKVVNECRTSSLVLVCYSHIIDKSIAHVSDLGIYDSEHAIS